MFTAWQADPRFRAWAARHPLTRGVARARVRALFGLCAGFVDTQALLAISALGIPELLLPGPARVEDLAGAVGIAPGRLRILLDAGCACGLLRRRRDGRYALAGLGAALVDNPGLRAMIAHDALLYDDLRDPVALLRGTLPAATALRRFWAYAEAGAAQAAAYSELMQASQAMIASEVLGSWPFAGRHRHVLDIGGGTGAFAMALARHAPALRVTVAELPAVAALAGARIAEARLASRVRAVGVDLLREPLPPGADLATLLRVLHDHDDAAAMRILRAARAALPPGATLLVAEPMAGERRPSRATDSYFGFYLLAMGQGRMRAPRRLRAMLRAAGFPRTRLVPTATPLLLRMIAAR